MLVDVISLFIFMKNLNLFQFLELLISVFLWRFFLAFQIYHKHSTILQFQRRFLAIGNLGLSIIFFASYLLFATIATRVFQEAFNVDTENGWIIVAMWVGWIFSVLTFICALGLLYLILNSKRSTDTVVKRVTTTHVSY